jgi:predicted Zn-ribbon and HTH transcriptional regulator
MKQKKSDKEVPEVAGITKRQEIFDLIRDHARDARELSQMVGISQRKVEDHLEHIARSAAGQGGKFVVVMPACSECGFEFKDRGRTTKPGKCPKCQNERLELPGFEIVGCPKEKS